jgi:hypothetical protein
LIPVFTGEISAFVTPWNTLHINGVDSFGHVSSLWWAPGFGTRWSYAALDPQGPVLAADSITSFTTPWGGLSVAGRDASTRIADVYWWSPASNQWTAEPLLGSSPALNPVLTGRFSSFVGPDDSAGRPIAQNIYGRAEDGSLYRFSWRPGDGPWTVENLTDLLG